MRRYLLLIVMCSLPSMAWGALDSASMGTNYGNAAGVARIQTLETQLTGMTFNAHPRVLLTPSMVTTSRARVALAHPKWSSILSSANSGNMINAAFAYLMLAETDPTAAATYATAVYNQIMAGTATTWSATIGQGGFTGLNRTVAQWAIAYDWAYNGLSESQRSDIATKIAASANITGAADLIRGGTVYSAETFHREEWTGYTWRLWPFAALATENTDAAYVFKSVWGWNWIYGDALRYTAYFQDWNPMEGYQYDADWTAWLLLLKSATGINLIDDSNVYAVKSAADYHLYNWDSGTNRLVFHRGVGAGEGGLLSYECTVANSCFNGRLMNYASPSTLLSASIDPKQQWFGQNVLGWLSDNALGQGAATPPVRATASNIMTVEYPNTNSVWEDYVSDGFRDIVSVLFYDPTATATDFRSMTYSELPSSKLFSGGKEAFMRTGFSGNATIAGFRASPALTKSSHGDFDVNTFLLYRKGNLMPDTGTYGGSANTNYMPYQKITLSHNNLLVQDVSNPDAPAKFPSGPVPPLYVARKDPGGTNMVTTYSFQNKDNTHLSATPWLYNSAADWGQILQWHTNSAFDWVLGDGSKAYSGRVDEYTRGILFIRRPNDKAYAIDYSRVNALSASHNKTMLYHFVTNPALNGNTLSTEVDGHIWTTDGDTFSATNIQLNSAVYGKVLLPASHKIRKVGGEGYDSWVDAATPYQVPTSNPNATSDLSFMDSTVDEAGSGSNAWRLELKPAINQTRDRFLTVFYVGDTGETPAVATSFTTSSSDRIGVFIPDTSNNYVAVFNNNKFSADSAGSFTYSVSSTGETVNIKHIITELRPSGVYDVTLDGVTVVGNVSANDQGILQFDTSGSGVYGVADKSPDADTTPPVTTIAPGTGTYSGTLALSLSCADNVACASTQYCVGSSCTPSTAYAGDISVSSSQTIGYRSTDTSGNVETTKYAEYTISAGAVTDGICGSSNGLALSSTPTVGLCSAGTASAVSGTGPWAWTCAGSGGGSTASCGATVLEVPPTGNASSLVACPVIAGFR